MAMTGPGASASRSGQREAQILGAAAELFRRKGYSATTLQDVAEQVGLHKSTLYHYFASKEELLFRIVTDVREVVDRVADDVAELDVDPLERVAAYLRRLIALGFADPARTTVFRDDLARLSPARHAEQLDRRRRQRDALAALIADAPVRDATDPQVLAEILIGAARGMVAYSSAPNPSVADAALMVDVLVHGLADAPADRLAGART
jgi:TetR/AcrR family transcriptional regulator, cholesterol catabolism regulator